MMRYASIFALAAVLISSTALSGQQPKSPPPEADAIPEQEIANSRAVTQKFADTLQSALQQALESGGPVNGIAVCREKAGQIATELSEQTNMIVGRTSLKLRNPNNAPDNWEEAVLRQFDARLADGEAVDKLEFFAVIDDDQGQKTFRYMKAIPTASRCLNCHGETVNADVEAKLKELYPDDKARGYKEGELRGAFTLAKPLP